MLKTWSYSWKNRHVFYVIACRKQWLNNSLLPIFMPRSISINQHTYVYCICHILVTSQLIPISFSFGTWAAMSFRSVYLLTSYLSIFFNYWFWLVPNDINCEVFKTRSINWRRLFSLRVVLRHAPIPPNRKHCFV